MKQIYSNDLDQRKYSVSAAFGDPLGYTQPLTRPLPTPVHTFAYFDYLMIRLDAPPTDAFIAMLRDRSAGVQVFKSKSGTTRVRISRPPRALLRDLPPDIRITSGEISLDLVFRTQADLWRAAQIATVNRIVPNHRTNQPLVCDSADRYAYFARKRYPGAGGKRRSVVPHHYIERESRCLRGSRLPCLHLEFRLRDRAMVAAGIGTVGDAARFDPTAFWSDKLRLVTVDPLRFGKMLARQGWTATDSTGEPLYGDSLARLLGRVHLNQFDNMQAMADEYRAERVLIPISAATWLPIRRRLLA